MKEEQPYTMKNFGKKWFISASSGLFGKVIFVIVLLAAAGIVGSVYLLPEESAMTRSISFLVSFLVITVTMQFFFNLHTLKEWAQERRQDGIKKLELENEQQNMYLYIFIHEI